MLGVRDRRHSLRLKDRVYSKSGSYFVTICTLKRDHIFGEVVNGTKVLNDCGILVAREWVWLGEQCPYVDVLEYIVMPNHLHGILRLTDKCRGTARRAPTKTGKNRKFGTPISNSLSTIIGSFKSVVTKHINILRDSPGDKVWQRNFHDRVIRGPHEYRYIASYIIQNPFSWGSDKYAIHHA